MLIYATIAIDVAAIAIWSVTYGVNGFKEIGKLLRGKPAFVKPLHGTYYFPDGREIIPLDRISKDGTVSPSPEKSDKDFSQ